MRDCRIDAIDYDAIGRRRRAESGEPVGKRLQVARWLRSSRVVCRPFRAAAPAVR